MDPAASFATRTASASSSAFPSARAAQDSSRPATPASSTGPSRIAAVAIAASGTPLVGPFPTVASSFTAIEALPRWPSVTVDHQSAVSPELDRRLDDPTIALRLHQVRNRLRLADQLVLAARLLLVGRRNRLASQHKVGLRFVRQNRAVDLLAAVRVQLPVAIGPVLRPF